MVSKVGLTLHLYWQQFHSVHFSSCCTGGDRNGVFNSLIFMLKILKPAFFFFTCLGGSLRRPILSFHKNFVNLVFQAELFLRFFFYFFSLSIPMETQRVKVLEPPGELWTLSRAASTTMSIACVGLFFFILARVSPPPRCVPQCTDRWRRCCGRPWRIDFLFFCYGYK